MTQEEKAKAYDEALERARAINSGKDIDVEAGTTTCEYIFPELKESEDEKIRKELIEHIKANKWADYVLFQKFSPDDVIAWLEKQKSVEEIVARCKDSWYNEGKIAGMAEGLSDDEKYQQGWHDAIEKQEEKPQGKTALEAVKEEKIDNANKIEPKFKVKYAGSEYDVLEIKEFPGGIIYYGIEDEPNHIDYVLPENCEIIKCMEWLKSLRHQKQWKPSEEQMNALDSTLQYSQVSHDSYEQLNSLYNDLKKLTK